jgi:MerR family transcriptional regulator, mercuric resistance operon regulatory protein
MSDTLLQPLRIGTLARRAGVGVETVRYYQRRQLLGTPSKAFRGQRTYPPEFVDRILFIRRAQTLGFALEDIATLLTLDDGVDRARARAIARRRLEDIATRILDLQSMRAALEKLLHDCEHTVGHVPCPIIAAIRDGDRLHTQTAVRSKTTRRRDALARA